MGTINDQPPDAETCVLAVDGEVIVRIYADESLAILTVRNPNTEGKASVELTDVQAGILADILQRVPPKDMEL